MPKLTLENTNFAYKLQVCSPYFILLHYILRSTETFAIKSCVKMEITNKTNVTDPFTFSKPRACTTTTIKKTQTHPTNELQIKEKKIRIEYKQIVTNVTKNKHKILIMQQQ